MFLLNGTLGLRTRDGGEIMIIFILRIYIITCVTSVTTFKLSSFFVELHFPQVALFFHNGELGVRTRYGDMIKIILNLRTCTFM